jgi:predicted ATPase/DNA-binding SARP family transcriptional activator/Tfp pilus assembly protein PilF
LTRSRTPTEEYMIRFRTLGGLELRRADGNDVRSVLDQPRRVGLLTYLLLGGDAAGVRRDLLLAIFWPESPTDRARHSLSQALYQLRQSLGREVIAGGEEQVRIAVDRIRCDAVAFRDAADAGAWEAALEHYRGELLPGFFVSGCPGFGEWLEEERARLSRAAAGGAWTLSAAAERAGSMADAAAWGRRAMEIEGGDELSLQRLLRLLHRCGDRAAAVAAYEAFARRLASELGVRPSDETESLIAEIRGPATVPVGSTGAEPRPGPAPATRIPRAETPLIGREAELARVRELIGEGGGRLISITGPGGVGKTRLAIEATAAVRDDFPDGVWFVPLAGVASSDLLPATLAQALGLGTRGADPDEALHRYLTGRRAVLVLDNLEHLLDAAPLLATLLDDAPELTLVATSREPLRLRREWVVPLEGLDLTDEEGAEPVPAAVRLFVELAGRMGGRVCPETEGDRLARICRLLDGNPLAIELATSWTRVLPLPEIEVEIARSRRFLETRLQDGPDRHRSLWAAFEHSWNLLERDQQRLLARLSVFRGGFDREAAQDVVGAGLPELAGIVDKSLLRVQPDGRYTLLETIREFAGTKLAGDPNDAREVRGRHSTYYARLLRHLRDGLSKGGRDDALPAAALEMDNIRTAWRGAVELPDREALACGADALFTLYDARGWHREAEAAFHAAVEALDGRESSAPPVEEEGSGDELVATLLARRGASLLRLRRVDAAESVLHRALELAERVGNASEAAFVLDRLGVLAWDRGDDEAAVTAQTRALELRRASGDDRAVAISLNNLGSLAYARGEYARARELMEACLELQRRAADATGEVISLQNLGNVALAEGDEAEAGRRLHASLDAARHARHGVLTIRSLLALASWASIGGRPDDAFRYLQPALARAMQIGIEPLALEAIVGIATARTHQNRGEEALALLGVAMANPSLEPGARGGAERLAAMLEGSLPAERIQAARENASALRLREVAAELVGGLPIEVG